MANNNRIDATALGRLIASAVTRFLDDEQDTTVPNGNAFNDESSSTRNTISPQRTGEGNRQTNEISSSTVQTLLPSLFGGVGRTENRESHPSQRQSRTAATAHHPQRPVAPKRKRSSSGVVGKAKTWNKDVVCIPESLFEDTTTIAIPRGRTRGELAEQDLIGKIRLVSTWSTREVREEISSVFRHLFVLGEHELLQFDFLTTVPGMKRLKIPNVSTTFIWNGQEVASLAGQGSLYILARSSMKSQKHLQDEDFQFNGDTPGEPVEIPNNEQEMQAGSSGQMSLGAINSTYSVYEELHSSILDDLVRYDSDDDLQQAIANSLNEQHGNQIDTDNNRSWQIDKMAFQARIREHSVVTLKSLDEGDLRFMVRRNFIWPDTVRKLKRTTRAELAYPIRVDFAGESAVDAGGPRREYFSLLIGSAVKANLLYGIPGEFTFSHNIEKLEKQEYYYLGMIIALSLLQGGSGPLCLCKPVAEYIAYGNITSEADVNEIPDYEIREKLKQVLSYDDDQHLQQYIDAHCEFRFDCGYSSATTFITSSKKKSFVQLITKQQLFYKCKAEVDQFVEGFKVHGILELLREHPVNFMQLLTPSEDTKLTADILETLFTPQFSPEGSNKRHLEMAIFMNWHEFLDDVQKDAVKVLFEEAREEETITFHLVLQFCTGASNIPVEGFFNQPSISFDHVKTTRLPSANSCANTLSLPVNARLQEYSTFKQDMIRCLADCHGFGNA